MTAAVVTLAIVCVGLAVALVAQVRQSARERRDLLDVIVARSPADLTRLRQAAVAESKEVRDYQRERDDDLRAMGYDPSDVPAVPHGL